MSLKGFAVSTFNRLYKGVQEYATLQKMQDNRVGLDVIQRAVFDVETISASSISKNVVELIGTTAEAGNLIQHVLSGSEFQIESVNGNFISCFDAIPSSYVGENFAVKKYVTFKTSKDGSTVVTATTGPNEFVLDSVNTQVNEDTTTPANNKPLPSKLFIQKDGITYPVNKDTGTPANTLAIPVEIVQASGTSINITAGDINVQTTHLGPNADSMRLGDGVTELGITLSGEAKTNDSALNTAIGTQTDATQINPLTDASLISYTRGIVDRLVAIFSKFISAGDAVGTSDSMPVMGSDGANYRHIKTDSNGRIEVIDSTSVSIESILGSFYIDTATTPITVAGLNIGSIASTGKTIQVSNNANDIAVEVNGVRVAVVLAGSPVKYQVEMAIGDVILKSLVGADISGGTASVNILG